MQRDRGLLPHMPPQPFQRPGLRGGSALKWNRRHCVRETRVNYLSQVDKGLPHRASFTKTLGVSQKLGFGTLYRGEEADSHRNPGGREKSRPGGGALLEIQNRIVMTPTDLSQRG